MTPAKSRLLLRTSQNAPALALASGVIPKQSITIAPNVPASTHHRTAGRAPALQPKGRGQRGQSAAVRDWEIACCAAACCGGLNPLGPRFFGHFRQRGMQSTVGKANWPAAQHSTAPS